MAGDDLGYGGGGYGAGRFMQGDSLFSQPGLMPWNYQAPQPQAPVPPILQSPAPQASPPPPPMMNNPSVSPFAPFYAGYRSDSPTWNMGEGDPRRYWDRGR